LFNNLRQKTAEELEREKNMNTEADFFSALSGKVDE